MSDDGAGGGGNVGRCHLIARRGLRQPGERGAHRIASFFETFTPAAPRGGNGEQHVSEGGHCGTRLGRPVGSCEKRGTIGQGKDVERPAEVAGEGRGLSHKRRINVGVFFTIDLDRDKIRVENFGSGGIGE